MQKEPQATPAVRPFSRIAAGGQLPCQQHVHQPQGSQLHGTMPAAHGMQAALWKIYMIIRHTSRLSKGPQLARLAARLQLLSSSSLAAVGGHHGALAPHAQASTINQACLPRGPPNTLQHYTPCCNNRLAVVLCGLTVCNSSVWLLPQTGSHPATALQGTHDARPCAAQSIACCALKRQAWGLINSAPCDHNL